MKKDVLCRPFPPELIKQRQGQGGKMLSYVETHAVIARLNEGCHSWAFEIVRHEIIEDEVIVVGKLVADGVIKMAFGGATVTRDREGRPVDLGDTHKSAASDSLKKAASLLGVGLELYGAGPHGHGSAEHSKRNNAPTTPMIEDRLTSRQLAAIHGAARRRGLGNQQLVALLVERTGKNGPQLLTKSEASGIIEELSGANGAAA